MKLWKEKSLPGSGAAYDLGSHLVRSFVPSPSPCFLNPDFSPRSTKPARPNPRLVRPTQPRDWNYDQLSTNRGPRGCGRLRDQLSVGFAFILSLEMWPFRAHGFMLHSALQRIRQARAKAPLDCHRSRFYPLPCRTPASIHNQR